MRLMIVKPFCDAQMLSIRTSFVKLVSSYAVKRWIFSVDAYYGERTYVYAHVHRIGKWRMLN